MDAFDRARQYLPSADFLEIRYEALFAEAMELFRQVADFAELPWTAGFERSLSTTPLRSGNERWRRECPEAQQAVLEGVLRAHLVRYCYPLSAGQSAA